MRKFSKPARTILSILRVVYFYDFIDYFKKMEKKKTIIAIVLSAFLTLLVSVTASFIVSRTTKIDNAAPIEYVDKRDNEILKHSDDQDGIIREQITTDKEAYDTKFNDMYKMILDLWKDKHE